jgi:hypothetical protein
MTDGRFDSDAIKAFARHLETDNNELLGTSATMEIARAFNRVKNREFSTYREAQYANHLQALVDENGPPRGPANELTDGWCIDTSRSLPHLDALLASAEEIIAARGGVDRGGGNRAFFQQILNDASLVDHPAILDFATSSDVLRPLIEYMRIIPTLSGALPLGARLNESDIRFVPDWDGKYAQSQLFHRDYHDSPMVYVIVCLRDVTMENGPFCFLPASTSDRATSALRYGEKGTSYRITDEEMYATVGENELRKLCYPAGTVLFLDSSRCFHYGSRDAHVPRYLMMYAYVSVCRTAFTGVLRPEATEPVSDADSRTRRMRYPVNASDSRLRRMVVDREFIDPEAT